MFAQIHVRNVLQFVAVLRIVVNAAAAASPRKSSLNRNRWHCILRILIASLSNELKARLVDRARAKHLGVCRLKSVFAAQCVVPRGGQAEGSHAVAAFVVPPVLVTRRQRVVRRHLIIESLAHIGACAWIGKGAGKLRDLQRGGIHERRVHYGKLIEVAPLDVEKKRCFLAQRTTHISAVLRRIVAGSLRCAFERVPRVEPRRIAHHRGLSVQLVCSGLGEDFYPAIAQLVVLR